MVTDWEAWSPAEVGQSVQIPVVVAREVLQRTADRNHVDDFAGVLLTDRDHAADVVDAAAVVFYNYVRKVDRCAASERIGRYRQVGRALESWASFVYYFDDLVVDETITYAPVNDRPFAAVFNRTVAYIEGIVVPFPVDGAAAWLTKNVWVALQTLRLDPVWCRLRMTVYNRNVLLAREGVSVDAVIIRRSNYVNQARTEQVDALDARRCVARCIFCRPLTVDVARQTACAVVSYLSIQVRQRYVRAVIKLRNAATCRYYVRVIADWRYAVAIQTVWPACSEVTSQVDVQFYDLYVYSKAKAVVVVIVDANLPGTGSVLTVEGIQTVETEQIHDVQIDITFYVSAQVRLYAFVVETCEDRNVTAAAQSSPWSSRSAGWADYFDVYVPPYSVVSFNAKVNIVHSSVNTYRNVPDELLARLEVLRQLAIGSSKLQGKRCSLSVLRSKAWEVARQQYRRAVQYRRKFVFYFYVTPALVAGSRIRNTNLISFVNVCISEASR